MKKGFLEKRQNMRKDHGRTLCDITIDKKLFHYIFEGLALYAEKNLPNKERVELDILIKELNELNAHMSGEELG